MEALGYGQPDPWVLNSSWANAIAVESSAMLDHYRQLGLASWQLQVTGSLIDDVLHRSTMQSDETMRSLGLSADRPVLLFSLPPNQLTAVRTECEFQEFSQ